MTFSATKTVAVMATTLLLGIISMSLIITTIVLRTGGDDLDTELDDDRGNTGGDDLDTKLDDDRGNTGGDDLDTELDDDRGNTGGSDH